MESSMRGIESAPAIEIAMSSIAAIFTICSFRSLQLFPLQLFRLLRLNPARRVHLTPHIHVARYARNMNMGR
jgi:hypothetical protein